MVDVKAEYLKSLGQLKPAVSLVVIGVVHRRLVSHAGHVDAGKSTLMGHLLCLLGDVSQKQLHKYPFIFLTG